MEQKQNSGKTSKLGSKFEKMTFETMTKAIVELIKIQSDQNKFNQLLMEKLETIKPTKKLLTAQEVAKMLNWKMVTLYLYTSKKEIPFIKRGKKMLFEETAIFEWLENGNGKTKKQIQNENNN